jgi:hypothetical protein
MFMAVEFYIKPQTLFIAAGCIVQRPLRPASAATRSEVERGRLHAVLGSDICLGSFTASVVFADSSLPNEFALGLP